MYLDPVLNFARVTVPDGYDDNDLVITLSSGHGARLPNPSADGAFNLVWYNSTDYPDATDDPLKEIVRCTGRSTDVITVTRAQEGTLASDHNIAGKVYKLGLAMTKKMIDDMRTALTNLNAGMWVHDYEPPEDVDGVNAVFTIPEDASAVIVYADGFRVKGLGDTYVFSGDDTITFEAGKQPFSTLSVDYLPIA